MGLDFAIYCQACNERTEHIEFSAVGFVQVKHPDELESAFCENWVSFLVKHSGHVLKFVDLFGNESDPAKVGGGYILGLDRTVPR